jgi:hypothetical protein
MQSMKWGFLAKFVMPGLVPGIHVLQVPQQERRGWPGQVRIPGMMISGSRRW